MKSMQEKIGSVFLLGFQEKTQPDEALVRMVEKHKAGNFIVFSRNLGSYGEIRSLCDSLHGLSLDVMKRPSIIAVDQEGGMVSRLQTGSTWFPGAMAVGAALKGRDGLGPDDLETLAGFMGAELRACGLDVNLAPVADVNSNPANPVIGVRSYGEDPDFVAECALAFAMGLQKAGIDATAKHFPGHGDTETDSHFGLPLLDHDRLRLDSMELIPFKVLVTNGVSSLMSAHILLPRLVESLGGDRAAQGLPATLNPFVLQKLLRRQIGFQGPLVSDCLTMKAIADHYPDAAVQALQAGIDLVCISHDPEIQEEAMDRVRSALQHGRLSMDRLDEASARVSDWQDRLAARPRPSLEGLPLEQHRALSARFSRASLASPRSVKEDFRRPDAWVDVLPARINGADDSLGHRFMADALRAKAGGSLEPCSCPTDPDRNEIARVLKQLEGKRRVWVGTYDAWRWTGQQDLVEALRSRGQLAGLACMRSPWDSRLAREDEDVLLAWEYTPLSVDSLSSFICEPFPLGGGIPVTL